MVSHDSLLEVKKLKETLWKSGEDNVLYGMIRSLWREWPREKESKDKATGKIIRQMWKKKKKDWQVKNKQYAIEKRNGKKLENCFMLLFANLAVNLGIFFWTQVTPLNFFSSSPQAEMVISRLLNFQM